jgi:RHS repeat-associated protein
LLNLPELIQFKNGCQIKNLYAADGKKLRSRYITLVPGIFNPLNPGQIIDGLDVNENDFVTIGGMDYINNIEYKVSRIFDWDVSFEPKDNISIKRVHNGEGYAEGVTYVTEGNEPAYSYYRRDHLGNNREVWCASYIRNNSVRPEKTMQRTQYYPSGLPWAESTGASVQQRKYNGKEFVGTHGLDEYDSQARMYYPAIVRTTTMDPLAEKYYHISPYAWCGNNPVNAMDPDGMDIYIMNQQGKMLLALKEDKIDKVFSMDNNGRLNGKNITINDKNLLPQLANGNAAETTNSNDAFNLFKFSVDNSVPEWSLKGYKQEKNSNGYLLTRGSDDGNSVSAGDGNYNPKNLIFNLHSHPPGDDNLGPSGWILKNGITYTADNSDASDSRSMLIRLNININTKHYIYHEGSQKLIYYDPNTVANKRTQNSRGVILETVKSATLLRTNILNRTK